MPQSRNRTQQIENQWSRLINIFRLELNRHNIITAVVKIYFRINHHLLHLLNNNKESQDICIKSQRVMMEYHRIIIRL